MSGETAIEVPCAPHGGVEVFFMACHHCFYIFMELVTMVTDHSTRVN